MDNTHSFFIESPAFKDGAEIPEVYTADGKNISPPLEWSQIPIDAQEFALICEDPDAPKESPFIHWVIYNIAKDTVDLKAALPPQELIETGLLQGKNSAGTIGYTGPKPPAHSGKHRYYFRLFALDERLNLPPGLTAAELLDGIRNHILAEAEVVGRYWYH